MKRRSFFAALTAPLVLLSLRFKRHGQMTTPMQRMPDIWDDQMFWTTKGTVLGALANWAVQQSPYIFPDTLTDGLAQFHVQFQSEEFFETSCKKLLKEVRDTFERCPAILAWNQPKQGKHQIAFCSRYDKPKPDYDFIDLDALARNIAHSCTVEEKYSQLHR